MKDSGEGVSARGTYRHKIDGDDSLISNGGSVNKADEANSGYANYILHASS